MEEIAKLASAIAWPLVALIGVFFLGPGKVLERSIEKLAGSISEFNRATKNFEEVALNVKKTIGELNSETSRVANSMDEKIDSVIVRLREIETLSRRSEEISANLLADKVTDDQRAIDATIHAEGGDPDTTILDPDTSPEALFEAMRKSWDELVDALKERVGADNFDARMIGASAWLLTDRRRRVRHISADDADLIARLHSQYKGFLRLQSSKSDWLEPALAQSFIRAVTTAAQKLRSK